MFRMVRTRASLALVGFLCCSAAVGVWDAQRSILKAGHHRLTPLAAELAELPRYPGVQWLPFGSSLSIDGQTRHMAYARTTDSVARVLDWQEGAWETLGIATSRGGENEHGWLIGTTPQDPWVRSLVVEKNSGSTTLILSLSEKFARAEEALWAPASCSLVTSADARDGSLETNYATFECFGKLDAILRSFDDKLGAARRRVLLSATAERKHSQVSYERGDEYWMVLGAQQGSASPKTIISVARQTR